MTLEEIFTHLSAHMIKGIMIHDQLANAYYFLNLRGYHKCHEYHYYEELQSYKHLHNFYSKHYHKLIPHTDVSNPAIIPPTWYRYTSFDVDINTKRTAIKDLMKVWVDWEKETHTFLQQSRVDLYNIGEINAALELDCYIKENGEELVKAAEQQINLEAIGYDMTLIVDKQDELYDKYKKMIERDEE